MSLLSELTSGNPHLSPGERAVSALLGLGLAAAAAKPRPNPLLNVLALVGGVLLAYRGATGYCHVKAALADRGRGGWLPHRDSYAGDRLPSPAVRAEPHGPSIPDSI